MSSEIQIQQSDLEYENGRQTGRQTERNLTFHYAVTECTAWRDYKQMFAIKLPL